MRKRFNFLKVLLLTIITCVMCGCGNKNYVEIATEGQHEVVSSQINTDVEDDIGTQADDETDEEEKSETALEESIEESIEETSESEEELTTTEAIEAKKNDDKDKKDDKMKGEKESTDSAKVPEETPVAKAENPVPETPEPVATPTPAPAPVVTPVPAPVVAANVVIIGDSRCVQMRDSTGGGGCVWICDNGKRYEWFAENAVPRADAVVGKGTKVVVCMGVNDTGDASKYAALVNVMAAQWAARGAKTYYVSVNPVWENPYTSEEQVMNFNATVLSQLIGVRWIDTHTYLVNTGYNLVDGLHYDNETNLRIFSAIIGSL